MISKNEIKLIRSLSLKKYREREGLFIAEGEKLVGEAVSSGCKIRGIYRTDDIGEENMRKITMLSSPSPVLAVVEIPQAKEPQEIGKDKLYIALDNVKDPGNVGTILRIADWFGIEAVYMSEHCADIYNPKTVQATMGAIFRVTTVKCELEKLCDRFLSAGADIFGTFMDGENIYGRKLPKGGLVIMGSEADGISGPVAGKTTSRLAIPSFKSGKTSESLNVAIAAAIVCSEFRRM